MKTGKFSFFITLFLSCAFSQGTWAWSGRVHSELEWMTIQTENFNVHYHKGIEEIARKGAAIAEQAYPVLLQQANIESTPRIDIVFTSEDEILNGYALWTNQTFIWVDQNDAAIWLEDSKWLRQVLTHEMQHIIFFNQTKTWIPQPFGFLFSGTPGWVVEGLAEFYTEKWRPYRADISHKYHVIKNKTSEMDPHHDGFSKILLMSDMFGDSTIVKILQHRNKLGLWNFKKAFKKYTHMSVSQFNEEWRQVMNTYYYGYKAQKESEDEIGKTATLPIHHLSGFQFSPDSLKIAISGIDNDSYFDQSLFVAVEDTSASKSEKKKFKGLFHSDKNSDNPDEGSKKPKKTIYTKTEIDFGRFHPSLSWSPNGTKLAYSKYHFGSYGSMIFDLRIYDEESKSSRWITRDARAAYPVFSPDGNSLIYVAHKNNVSNLYQYFFDGSVTESLTNFNDDIQIMSPAWSPDGQMISFARSDSEGNTDLVVLNIEDGSMQTITDDPSVDYLPIWHPDNQHISFTSHRNGTPNIFTLTLKDNQIVQNTDVGEAVWGIQWSPKGNTILAKTMDTADSVRVVQVDPARRVDTAPLNIRDHYAAWMSAYPEIRMPQFDTALQPDIRSTEPYSFIHNMKHMTSFILPLDVLTGATIWTDALGKNIVQVIGGSSWDAEYPFILAQYINAQHGPLWGINYFYNTNWSFRFYDESNTGLLEKFDGLNIWLSQPYNAGSSMSSNHMVTLGLSFFNREVIEVEDEDNQPHLFTDLLTPEEGNEGIISFDYKWVNRRPDKRNLSLPHQGWGLNLNGKFASREIYGDFTYERYRADSFINLDAGIGSLYFRGLGELLQGNPPVQDYVGFSRDLPIYGPGSSGALGLPENINPRGWDGVRLGDKLIFGTSEFRFPLLPSFPMNFLGLNIGEITGALISDFGNVWNNQTDYDWIVTAGYELKVGIKFGDSPLFIVGAGEAQLVEEWQDNKTPRSYVRFSMINPF